jgi:hypothetical protein
MLKRDATPNAELQPNIFFPSTHSHGSLDVRNGFNLVSCRSDSCIAAPHVGDKWTTIGIIAAESVAIAGISIVSVFFVRQRKLSLPPPPSA